jgi:hypothetical protein
LVLTDHVRLAVVLPAVAATFAGVAATPVVVPEPEPVPVLDPEPVPVPVLDPEDVPEPSVALAGPEELSVRQPDNTIKHAASRELRRSSDLSW